GRAAGEFRCLPVPGHRSLPVRRVKLEDTFLVTERILVILVVILVFTKTVIAHRLIQLDRAGIVLAHFQAHVDTAGIARRFFTGNEQTATESATANVAVDSNRVK